jgi:hypothetical protein
VFREYYNIEENYTEEGGTSEEKFIKRGQKFQGKRLLGKPSCRRDIKTTWEDQDWIRVARNGARMRFVNHK